MLKLAVLDRYIVRQIVRAVTSCDLVDKIILFGSRARGDSSPDSDFDLVVIGRFTQPSHPARCEELRAYLGDLSEVGLDLIPVTMREYDDKFLFRTTVEKEGIVLYDRDESRLAEVRQGRL